MKISKGRLREIVKEVIKEESDYQMFFKKALEKSGKSLGDMTDQEKKDFFNKIDKSWKGKGEKNEGNAFGAAVTKAKEQGKDSFKVGGKTYKVKEDITISKDDMEKLHTDKEIEVDGEKITYDESVVNEGFSSGELQMVRRQVSNYAKKYVRGDFDQAINFMRGILDDIERERKDKK